MMLAELIATSQLGQVDLLLITDQKDSSRNPTSDLPLPTKRHFERFIGLLRDYKSDLQFGYVVKNVGDSLMIRFRLTSPSVQIPLLLRAVAEAQDYLLPNRTERKVPIRAIAMLLKSGEFIEGKSISYEHPKGVEPWVVPGERLEPHWLAGDIFGPGVALAFRAAQIPKEPVLVVEDGIATMLEGYRGLTEAFSVRVDEKYELHFSEALAFSPLKGLEDLYPFAKKDTSWPGHLFLRLVSHHATAPEQNSLLLDQQKVRVFTRLVWAAAAAPTELTQWVQKLRGIEGEAGYIRSLACVRKEQPFRSGKVVGQRNKTGTRLLMAFAGPTDATYGIIRDRIESIKKQNPSSGFLYPVSTFVYASPESDEATTPFWPKESVCSYVLLLARWDELLRLNTAGTFQGILNAALQGLPLRNLRSGLILGGEWDVYSVMTLDPVSQAGTVQSTFKELSSSIWQNLRKQGVEAAEFYLCEDLLKLTPEEVAARLTLSPSFAS